MGVPRVVLISYENSLLYLILQSLTRNRFWRVLIDFARFWAWNYYSFTTVDSPRSRGTDMACAPWRFPPRQWLQPRESHTNAIRDFWIGRFHDFGDRRWSPNKERCKRGESYWGSNPFVFPTSVTQPGWQKTFARLGQKRSRMRDLNISGCTTCVTRTRTVWAQPESLPSSSLKWLGIRAPAFCRDIPRQSTNTVANPETWGVAWGTQATERSGFERRLILHRSRWSDFGFYSPSPSALWSTFSASTTTVSTTVDHSWGVSQIVTHKSAHSKQSAKVWWARRDSNPGPRDYESPRWFWSVMRIFYSTWFFNRLPGTGSEAFWLTLPRSEHGTTTVLLQSIHCAVGEGTWPSTLSEPVRERHRLVQHAPGEGGNKPTSGVALPYDRAPADVPGLVNRAEISLFLGHGLDGGNTLRWFRFSISRLRRPRHLRQPSCSVRCRMHPNNRVI